MAGALSLLLAFSVAGCKQGPAPSTPEMAPVVDVERSTFTVSRTEVMTDPSDFSVGVVRIVDSNGETVMGAEVTIVGRFGSDEQSFDVRPTDESGQTAFSMVAQELLTVTLEAHVRWRDASVVLDQKPVLRFVAGPPRTLAFKSHPFSTVAGATLEGLVSVSAVDAFNHPVTRPFRVTLALAPGSEANRLEGQLTVPLAKGEAVFPYLRILGAGSATLVASAMGAPAVTGNAFTVYSSLESALRFDTPVPASVPAGAPLTSGITLALTDDYGNPRNPSPSSCWRVELSVERKGKRSPLAAFSSTRFDKGFMTLPPVRVFRPEEDVRLVAHCQGLQDAVSTPFTVLAGPPDAAASSLRATPERLVASEKAQALLRVQLLDAGGNPVVDAPVQLSVSDAGAVLVPASGAGRTDGRGVFSATLTSTQPREVRVSATAGGLAMDTKVSFVPACSATIALPMLPVVGADILGDPRFTNSPLLPVDLDRDGHPDVVSTDGRIYDNAGDGTLVLRETDSERVSGLLAVGDLDGDGAPDLLSAGDIVAVRFNRGDGSLFPPQPLVWGAEAVGESVKRAWVVDVNGDGLLDVAYTVRGMYRLTLHVLLNQGGGVFAPDVRSPLMADADDDAVVLVPGGPGEGADAALVVHPQSMIHVFQAGVDGRFVNAGTMALRDMPRGLLQADVDGDGRDDVLVRYYGGVRKLTLLGHPGQGRFADPVDVSTDADVGTVAVADVDGDGGRDIALISTDPPYRLVLVRRDVAGGFRPGEQLRLSVDPASVSAEDLTGDGRPELLVSSKAGVLPLLNQGDGTFSSSRPTGISGAVFLVRGDFNGDKVVDVGGMGGGSGSLLISQPDGTRAVRSVPMPGLNAVAGVGADMDRDGLSDLVIVGTSAPKVYVMRNESGGTFTQREFALSAIPGAVAVGDLDGDDASDVAVLLPSLSQVHLLHNDGTGTLTPWRVVPVGPASRALALAELDGDGHLDLVVAHSVDGSVWRFLNDGSGRLTLQTKATVGKTPMALAAGDVDGDGLAEVVVANQEGTVGVLPGSGGPLRTYPVGRSPTDVVLGDFNGDGHPDIAVAEDNWRVGLLPGQEGGGFSRHQGQAALLFVHALQAQDWDGDGRMELLAAGGSVELLTSTCVR
ncbi:FG-GAP-like repeat-containing protein [Vitiosangium sp. GDMCC 1.1324]|uniref:FG-GAP-like repeat-containing protein n=1 Tax=Vitiosangium sp. (strain GDMCC 1.1324) TaxID=2138576 RepID=UPI00130E8945|nr:FG-GAP-like repeat-containing protein [Vitiosangium sp. GDMCC 1.1324]